MEYVFFAGLQWILYEAILWGTHTGGMDAISNGLDFNQGGQYHIIFFMFNHLHTNLFRANIQYIAAFSLISEHWDCLICLETNTPWFHIANTLATDDLVTYGVSTSATTVLTKLFHEYYDLWTRRVKWLKYVKFKIMINQLEFPGQYF